MPAYREMGRLERLLREWPIALRRKVLEDGADRGLGGPPNAWQQTPFYPSCGWGGQGREWHIMWFHDDAGMLGIDTKYADDEHTRHLLTLPAADFRRLALWYLWRWGWGEWFGLRRTLFYWDLRRRVRRFAPDRDAARKRAEAIKATA